MKSFKNLLIYIGLLCIIAVEFWAGIWILSPSSLTNIYGFGLHILLVLLFSFLIKSLHLKEGPMDINFTLISFILTLVLPVYGMLGVFLLHITLLLIKMPAVEYFELDESFLSKENPYITKDVDKSIISIKRDELEIDAFMDIFRSNDRVLEENAINKLSKIVNKSSVSILQHVVKESTTDTKVLAASALIEIENKIINKIDVIRNKLIEEPEQIETILELARMYDLYCFLGVLDTAVNKHYQKLALEQYQTYLLHNPADSKATVEYGRILLNSGNLEKAVQILNKAIELDPDNPNSHIWLAQAHYELADYRSVKKICEKLSSFQKLPEILKPVVHWWSVAEAQT